VAAWSCPRSCTTVPTTLAPAVPARRPSSIRCSSTSARSRRWRQIPARMAFSWRLTGRS